MAGVAASLVAADPVTDIVAMLLSDCCAALESVRENRIVELSGSEAIAARWPQTGPAIIAAGFTFTHAIPLRWHGHVLGGLNLFHADAPGGEGWAELAQSFADIASLVIVSSAPIEVEMILQRAQAAMLDRTLIERAKGVIAYERNLDMGEAYAELVRRAEQQAVSLTTMASTIIEAVARPR
jgi:hypothetical protein